MNDEYEIVFSVGVTIDIDRRQKDGGDDQSGTGNRSCLQSQVHSMQTALGTLKPSLHGSKKTEALRAAQGRCAHNHKGLYRGALAALMTKILWLGTTRNSSYR